MKRLQTRLGWLGGWRPFGRRGPAVCERCPWLEFCGRPTLVADAGGGADGLHDVIVTFRVVRWLTSPVAKFVIVQTRVRPVDLSPHNHFLVRISAPWECAAQFRCLVPHQAPATTVVAGVGGTRVELLHLNAPSQRTGAAPAACTSRSSAVISNEPVSVASAR